MLRQDNLLLLQITEPKPIRSKRGLITLFLLYFRKVIYDMKIKKGYFSIIAPIYKDAYKTFAQFHYWIKQQDYSKYEIIVVLDGPNKKARQELKRYKDIIICEKPWGGAPSARNFGAKKSSGEYLTFLDPDVYLYPGTLRHWATQLEDKSIDFVYGDYDIDRGPTLPSREFEYLKKAIKFTNFISGAFPMRREIFPGWDEKIKSLQDWDMWLTIIENGHKGKYIDRRDFHTEPPGNISKDSDKNWIKRTDYIRNKHGNPKSDICVTSLGASEHALHVADKLKADFLEMPNFKAHKYKMIYLLGFYPESINDHLSVFFKPKTSTFFKGKKLIHFIGTDIYNILNKTSFETIKELRKYFKDNKFTLLTEAPHTQKELAQRGVDIDTEIVPIPTKAIHKLTELPKKFVVANYVNPTQDMYHEKIMLSVARSMPDIEFKFFGGKEKKKEDNIEYVGWVDMEKFIPKCSALTRMTVHDGLPLGPIEFMQAGRNVITNVPLKHTINCKPIRGKIIKAIRKAQKAKLNEEGSKYWTKQMNFNKYIKKIKSYL